MRNTLVWLAASLLVALLLLGLISVLALYSKTGTRFALNQLQAMQGDTLQIDDVSGSLAGGVQIGTLSYIDDKTRLKITDARIRLTLGRLLRRELMIDSISIDTVELTAAEASSSDEASGSFAVPTLPLDIVLATTRINKITYRGAADEIIDDLNVSLAWRSDYISVDGLSVRLRDTLIQGEGQMQLRDSFPLSFDLSWQMDRETPLRGKAVVTGTLSRLEIQHELIEPYRVTTNGYVIPETPLRFDLTSQSNAIDYTVAERTLKFRDLQVSVVGNPDDYELGWRSAASSSDLPLKGIAGLGNGNTQGLAIRNMSVDLDRGSVGATGQVNWSPQIEWVLDLELNDIDPAQLQADWPGALAGKMRLKGNLSDTELNYALSDIAVAGLLRQQPVSLTGQLTGDAQGLRSDLIEVGLDQGRINSRGRLGWSDGLQWDIDADFFNLDPSVVLADWPGKLSGRVGLTGRLNQGQPEYRVDNLRSSGELRGQTISVRGSVEQSAGGLLLEDVNVLSGDNRVTLNGSIGEQLAINYDVDVSDLGSFSKDYSGMLKGAGRLAGTLSAPQVDMALTGRDLRIAGYAAGSVDINGQLLPEKTASELVLSARQLEISGRPVDSLDATLKGEIGEHQVMLQASMDKRSLSASLSGGWQEQKWRGQLGDVLIDLGPQGQWQQTDKTNLVFDAEQLQLESLCLQQESALACAQGSLGLKNIDASILLDRFPLAPLTAYLPAGVTVKGEAGGQIMLSGSAREPLADLRLSSSTIALHYSYSEDDDVVDTTLRDLLLTARADINNLNFDLQVAGDDIRSLSLNARLDNWRDASPRIVAKLDANIPDVAFLSMLSTEVSGWKGSAAADFTVSGLLSAPQLEGFIRLENGSAELRGAGITLQQLEIVARPSGAGRLGVTASAVSGNGKIELDGMLALDAKAGWPVSGSLSGSDFSALQLPGLDVVVSPDLTISGDAGMLQLRGTVVAPRAKVEIRQLPEQAVSVSSDVVIQGVENQSKKSLLQVDTDIEVLLGDAVSFSGFGLSASLAGQIALRVPPDRPATGRGVVKIKSGKFQAYGQDLSIENGRLIFSGALDDPTLDVEANRKIADVTVGVRIAGTGQSPEATIYSVPSMPEAEALSYLVIGRPLASATDAEGEQLKNSAILLGLKQALPIADQIGRAVGLDELGLDTSSTDTGAIMAGKQVGSDLYVRYSFGLFDRIGALLLRYRVNRNVSLEARSAEDQSLDVIYSRGRE